jgi:hypothetical protein
MARTTGEEVREIMSGCTLTDEQIDPFILGTHLYLNAVFASNTTLGVTILRELERWLTAHVLALTGAQPNTNIKREKVGNAEIEYAVGKAGTGLLATPYGQWALHLDTTGLLAKTGKREASLYAIESFDEDE